MNIERTDRCNWSTLKSILTSPKHYLHSLTRPQSDSPALLLGSVTHCAIFEPDRVAERYIVAPRMHRGMNDETARAKGYEGGKQTAAAWDAMAASTSAVPIDFETMALANAMRDAVRNDPVAGPLVAHGRSERNIEWTDPETGIECRGRFDHVNGVLADLKTTRSLMTCERDAARFGYPGQLSWYHDGMRLAGYETSGPPCLVFVESAPPHDVLVLTFDPEDIELGRRVYRSALDRLAECRRTGFWPGVSNGVARRIALPPWAGPVEEVELTIGGEPI